MRKIGVLFADISGTTRLYRRIGTKEAQRALERCLRRMERAIESHRGEVLTPDADEMTAVFPAAEDAILAAIEMQERIADLPPASGVKLSIRIGVHFGVAPDRVDSAVGAVFDDGRALLNIAGPHQILTSAPTAEALSPTLSHSLRSLDDLTVETAEGESQLYELAWQGDDAAVDFGDQEVTAPAMPELAAATGVAPTAVMASRPPSERLCVRYEGKAYLIDERTPALVIGRDKACDIVIRDRKASRVHVRLEKRDRHRFFLTDLSTNGTFVVIGKERERCVHNDEVQLFGRGRLAFGHSVTADDAEVIDFESL